MNIFPNYFQLAIELYSSNVRVIQTYTIVKIFCIVSGVFTFRGASFNHYICIFAWFRPKYTFFIRIFLAYFQVLIRFKIVNELSAYTRRIHSFISLLCLFLHSMRYFTTCILNHLTANTYFVELRILDYNVEFLLRIRK